MNLSTRRLFTYVPQGNLLFSGTLRENLLLANSEASKNEIHHALFVCAMDEYLPQQSPIARPQSICPTGTWKWTAEKSPSGKAAIDLLWSR